jgi:DNA-binding NtrC family response regulator
LANIWITPEQEKAMFPESVILVFEGASAGTNGVARTLSDHYRVIEADTLDDALKHASENVDLVVGHLESTNSETLQLLRQWKARQPNTPFLILTNGVDVSAAVKAMKLGAADCIVKPVDPSQLRMAVAGILEGSAAQETGASDRSGDSKPGIDIPPGTSLEELERAAVEQALAQHHGNRTHAAKTLGISVRTLQRKLKAWGMPLHSNYGNSGHGHTNGPGNSILYSVHGATSTPMSTQYH